MLNDFNRLKYFLVIIFLFASEVTYVAAVQQYQTFPPITIEDIQKLDPNPVINADNVAPVNLKQQDIILNNLANLLNRSHIPLNYDHLYKAVTCLANKHIVGEIDGTVGIESSSRGKAIGSFLAITGNWGKRFNVAYKLFEEATNDPQTEANTSMDKKR